MGRRSGKASGGSEGKLQDATNTAPPSPSTSKTLLSPTPLLPRRQHWSTSSNNNDSATSSSSRLSNAKKSVLGYTLRFKKRIRHRTALFILFGIMELVLVAAFLLAFRAGEVVAASSFHGSCMDSVGSVHLSVIKKVDQLLQSLENVAYNRGVQRLAQGAAAAGDAAKILSLMQYVQGIYEVEYMMLLAANATVLMSVNNASRVGEAFNPGGVVELASRDGGRSLWMPGVLTYEELLLESPTLYRDRENNLDMAFKGGHPYETHADAYIRWVVVPIYPINETSWSPPTDGTPPIGYVIGGDLGSGKSALTSLVSETLSGFGGVYMEPLDNEATKGDKKWLTVSASMSVFLKAKYMAAHADVPVLVEGFSPLQAMADKQNKWLDAVVDEKGAKILTIDPFAVAGRVWEHDAVSHEMAPIDGGAPVRLALVRGVLLDPVARATRLIAAVVGLFGIFLLDALALMLATWLFLSPLEKMGRRVAQGQRVDVGYLRSLSRRRFSWAPIALVSAASLGVGVFVGLGGADEATAAVRRRSADGPGSAVLAWRYGIDGTGRFAASTQGSTTLRNVLAHVDNETYASEGRLRMAHVGEMMQAEFAVLVNKTLQVVAAPNCPELQGMVWDPASLVSDTIKSGLRYTRSALVQKSELELFKAPVFADKLVATTPTSALHPSMTSAPDFESVIRWQSTPIWTAGPGSSGPPDGAMLFGSIANGKTRIPEMANRVARQGYSAVYYYDSSGQYQLASSVLLQPDGTLAVDVPLASTAWLDALRTGTHWLTNGLAAVTAEQDVGGRRHVVSAHCQTKNTQINAEGGWDVLVEWDGAPTHDCWVFLVQGLPWAAVSRAVDAARGWQYFFIAVCVAKLAAMWALCYRAYRPFSKIVLNRFVQNARIVDAPESPVPSPRGAEVGTPARPALGQTISKTSMSNTAANQSPA